MKRKALASLLLISVLLGIISPSSSASAADTISIDAPSAILIEVSGGEILYEKDAFTHRSPASVTKLMTMLLAAEAVDCGKVSLEDTVCASENAASMGGSQIWLEEGESMSFGEMLKCVTVVSANDCCVAIAEHLSGSEEAFVAEMNLRARELGLKDSHFTCCSGLSDSDEHYSCAHDLALIGRELLKHDFIRDYTTLWTDSIRGGEFGLTNTNKLIYHYSGATGLKTGFTSKAMHCLAASAERNGEEYIAVILGAPSSSARFESAKKLLDHAFANYCTIDPSSLCALPSPEVKLGKKDCVALKIGDGERICVKKDLASDIRAEIILSEQPTAPIEEGSRLGLLQIKSGDSIIKELPVLAAESVEKKSVFDICRKMLGGILAP